MAKTNPQNDGFLTRADLPLPSPLPGLGLALRRVR